MKELLIILVSSAIVNNEDDRTAHAGCCLHTLGNTKERTEAKELAENYVIYNR